ncbi:MAG: FAD-dependent oxidoreductase [Chloroflexota bacterium]
MVGPVAPRRRVLARPTGRLRFAGEHTDPWQAPMQGAIRTGQRAVAEVLAFAHAAVNDPWGLATSLRTSGA